MERALGVEFLEGEVDVNRMFEYLWPLAIDALKHPKRFQIFEFIMERTNDLVSFTDIKNAFPHLQNAALSFHLQKLKDADLIAREVRYEDRVNDPEHHYSFYKPTVWGKAIWAAIKLARERCIMELVESLAAKTSKASSCQPTA